MAEVTGTGRKGHRISEPHRPDQEAATVDVGMAATAQASGDPRTAAVTVGPQDVHGRQAVEVVLDGWRFDLVVEDAARAALRERATRDRGAGATAGGAIEIRAIIPGRIVSVAVAARDEVVAGQTLLVVEAMKMQNDLRSPRAGRVRSVAVGPGSTVDVGDVLVTLE
ncbi:MAG TPA: biotin/lipoyl-containing protein [Candidatus Saccharimonadales bacterium]|nr:biotin/lipoyl-containing protein [Candidatus Saccharimonadales bacterium]